MTNPLLDVDGLPRFSELRSEHVEPAIRAIIDENKASIDALLARPGPHSWDSLIQPLDELDDRLKRAWSPVRHMNAVVSSDALRAAHDTCLPLLSAYSTELGQNRALNEAYRHIRDSEEYPILSQAQQKSIDDALREFRLSGVDLPDDKKRRFKEIQQRLSELQSRFENNLMDATHAWSKCVADERALAGLPEHEREMARQTATSRELDGWVFTLEFPSYHAVMIYADDREWRAETYHAYMTRASDQGDWAEWDNSAIMGEILALRHESANLLDFSNYAWMSLARKMAGSPDEVMAFLRDLAARSRARALEDYEELRGFAGSDLGIEDLQAWDLAYASEKLKQKKYALSQEMLKPYFPVERALGGLFSLVERLFGVLISQAEGVDVWHPDVRFYEIRHAGGELRGQFYLDLYARAKKRGGAWMDECRNRVRRNSSVQAPVAYMTCNSTPPVGDKPALFTHQEVITLFHEFGHGLHHMLTQVDYPAVSGINGVEWDAVELPSQFMENWCWERETLDLIAAHYETNESLPQELFERLVATKNFQSGMQMVRQLEFALFDMRIHAEYERDRGGRIQEILNEVRREVAVVPVPAFNRFQHGFAHIFGGGYAAGYYSYKWAEVLSADAFARFEEEGLFNAAVGRAFLHHILERGGSQPALELFRAFRGREPSNDALLRHSGLIQSAK